MNSMRILGAVCATILASSLGTLAACGGSPDAKDAASTAQAVSAANVSIALFDAKGVRVGEGSGVMIAPRLVLTSGHLISGKYKWVVTSADGKQKATGSRGMTYDWMRYDSNKAHPRRHDVGVIHLDETIKLASYPKLVGDLTADGAKATRIRGTGAAFHELGVTLEKVLTSPNAWLADMPSGETLDTGGAVYDERGIVGVVSGRGTTTGKLYVARIDGLLKWLSPKVACAGGATVTRTYAPPATDKSQEICEDAGAGSGSSDDGTGATGGPGGGGPGGEGTDGSGSCSGNNEGVCSGACEAGETGPLGGGDDGTGGSGGSSGSNGAAGPGGDGSGSNGGSSGGSSSGSSGSDGASNPGGDGTGDTGGTGGTGGTAGSSGSSGSSGADGASNPGGSGGTGGSSGGGGSSGSSGSNGSSGSSGVLGSGAGAGYTNEVCQGASDNPELCPPEPSGCTGPNCGGGQPDDSIDYGACACGSTSGGSIYLR